MAVPKKKRSRPLVRSRRSNNLIKLLNKHNISIQNYSNFIDIKDTSNVLKNTCAYHVQACAYYEGSTSKHVCLDCYLTDFIYAYRKNIK